MSDVTIAVMGATGTGKSTFINLLSGSAFPVGEGLRSCTPKVQTSPPFELDGHRITLIDTPGFDDTLQTDTEILRLVSTFLADSYRANTTLSGIVYMHRISDVRAGGISRRNFALLPALCGDAPLRNVVVATNMWGAVDAARGAQREAELAADPLFFQPALARGARMVRHTHTRESALAVLAPLVAAAPVPLQVQRELVDEGRAVEHTAAAAALCTEEMRAAQREQAEAVQRRREEMAAALRASEAQRARELEALRRQQEAEQAMLREEQEEIRRERAEARREERARRAAAARALAEQERQRKAKEQRLEQLRVDQALEQREQEEARRRHNEQLERVRDADSDDGMNCVIF